MWIFKTILVSLMLTANVYSDDKVTMSGFFDCNEYNLIMDLGGENAEILQYMQATFVKGYISGRNSEAGEDGQIADLKNKDDYIINEINSFCRETIGLSISDTGSAAYLIYLQLLDD